MDQLKREVFGKHWQDETWHEVLRLIAGMIDAKFVGKILDDLMAQNGEEEKFINLFLAAKCLAEVRNRSVIASIATKLLNKIKHLTKYDLWYYYVPNLDQEETKLVQEIRTQAVAAVATTWQESPDTKTILIERAATDNDEDVRRAAVEELARGFKDDPGMFEVFYNCAVKDPFKRENDEQYNPRQVALNVIIKQYAHYPQTLPLLRDKAENDLDEQVREFAKKKLAALEN